jgi:small subunit ribosomal protein S20
LRTQIKKLRSAVDAGEREEAKALLPVTVSLVDKSVQQGILHSNAAARHKSRLTTSVNGMAS